jgi:uncharacterized protein YjbI with pentapeptide repeats
MEVTNKRGDVLFTYGDPHNFSDLDLPEADFAGMNLAGANFCDADLSGADFRGANLYWATFFQAN